MENKVKITIDKIVESLKPKDNELIEKLKEERASKVSLCNPVSNRFGDVYGWDLFKSN